MTHRNEAGDPSFEEEPPAPPAPAFEDALPDEGDAASPTEASDPSAEEDPLTSPAFRLRPPAPRDDTPTMGGFGGSEPEEDPLTSPSFRLPPPPSVPRPTAPADGGSGASGAGNTGWADEDPLTSGSFPRSALSGQGPRDPHRGRPSTWGRKDPLTSGELDDSAFSSGEGFRGRESEEELLDEKGLLWVAFSATNEDEPLSPSGPPEQDENRDDPLTSGEFGWRTSRPAPTEDTLPRRTRKSSEDPLTSAEFRIPRSSELEAMRAAAAAAAAEERARDEASRDEADGTAAAEDAAATGDTETRGVMSGNAAAGGLTAEGTSAGSRRAGDALTEDAASGNTMAEGTADAVAEATSARSWRVGDAFTGDAASGSAVAEGTAAADAAAEGMSAGSWRVGDAFIEDAASGSAVAEGTAAADAAARGLTDEGMSAGSRRAGDAFTGDAASGNAAAEGTVTADAAARGLTDENTKAGKGTAGKNAAGAEGGDEPGGAGDGTDARDGAGDALEIAEVPEAPVAESAEPVAEEPAERPGDVAVGERLAALERLVELSEGRLDGELVDEAAALLERAGERMRLSGEHTVVALAGGTGSGKSSLFNAVCGLELSPSGMRRPMTSSAHACVWGHDGAGPLLDWLAIDKRYRYARAGASAHRGAEGENSLEGLVLIDLPDHDSIQAVHRAEVDRFVGVADLLVWVVDPQKYADAALHRDYIVPFARHASVTLIVLNQVDRLRPAEAEDCVSDLRRLLESEGLADPHIITTSAVTEGGVDGLRAVLAEAVSAGNARAERLGADLDAVAERFAELAEGGPVPVEIDEERAEGLVDALVVAAGAPAVAEAMESAYELRAADYVGWPFARWAARLRRDPLRTIRLTGLRDELRDAFSGPMGAQQGEVDNALHGITDGVAADIPEPWRRALRAASRSRAGELPDALGEALREVIPSFDQVPRWWWLVRIWQLLLVACAFLSALWSVLVVVYGVFGLADPPAVLLGDTGILPWLLVLTACLFGMGALTAAACRNVVALSAARHGERVKSAMREGIARVGDEKVLTPVAAELSALADFRSTAAQAHR